MNTADLLSLEFPVFTAENPALEPPVMTAEEWVVWVKEGRKLQSPAALEDWLRDPNSLPRGERFELWFRMMKKHPAITISRVMDHLLNLELPAPTMTSDEYAE
jgi:hypothetical protein